MIFTLLLTLFILLSNPSTQTYTARLAAEYLSEELNTEIKIEELRVNAFFNIILKGVEVKDLKGETVLKSESVQLNFIKSKLRSKKLALTKVILDESEFNLAIYKDDSISNLQTLLNALSKSDSIKTKPETNNESATVWDVSCEAIQINNGSFSLTNQNKPRWPRGVDFDYMDITNLNLDIDNLKVYGDSLGLRINELSLFDENSGFNIRSFEGDFIVSNTILDAKKLKIDVMDSKLDMDFSFNYKDFRDFKNFEENILIIADIRPTRLNMADIGYFAPELFIMENVVNLSMNVKGTVSDFHSQNLIFNLGDVTHFEGNVGMRGLPDIETTYSYAKINQLSVSANDLKNFAIPGNPTYIDLAEEFDQLGICEILGYVEGVYNDFDANLVMRSESGNFLTDMKMTTNETGDITRYTGRLRSIDFNVGKVFGVEEFLGEMNLDIDFDGSGLRKRDVALLMNGYIDSLEFKGNKYNRVRVNGRLYDNKFSGNLNVNDEKLGLDFNGLIDHSTDLPSYDFQASINNAHLYDINLFDHNPTAILSTDMNINFTGYDLDSYNGTIEIDSTRYYQDGINYFLEKVVLEAEKINKDEKHLQLQSDYIDADLKGTFLFNDLVRSVNEHLALYMPAVFAERAKSIDSIPSQDFEFNVQLKNTGDLSQIFFPELTVYPNSIVHGLYNSELNRIHMEANSEEVTYRGIRFVDFYAKTNNDEDSFLILTGSNDMIFKNANENDTLALGLENLNVLATIQHDSIDYRLRWDDYESSDENRGYLAGYLKYFSPDKSELKIYRTDFQINDNLWRISENNLVSFDSTRVELTGLNISSELQSFGFDGIISEFDNDTVKLEFDNWEFSNFDMLINNMDLDIDGTLSGYLNLANIYDDPNLDVNLDIKNLIFNNESLGEAKIETKWNPFKKTLFSEIFIVDDLNSFERSLNMIGTYTPGASNQQLNFDLKLQDFNFKTVEPFVSSFISDLDGTASGDFKVRGTNAKPIIEGDLELKDTEARIDYLNVNYKLSNIVKFRKNEIRFEDVVVQDSLDRISTSSGRITHDYFRNFDFDIWLHPQNVACLNTNAKQNDMFYGNANASGDMHIHGPIDNMIMDITLETERGTEINIPLNNNLELTETDYIVFVNNADTVHEVPDYTVDLSGLSINLNLSINEDADMHLFLPYNMGRIDADGNSEMSIIVNSRGDFEIFGDYFINQGTFLFTLQNIVNRRFSIMEGGKISWNGNPYDALINVRALYKTKASLAEIDPDLTRRVNVDCYLSLKEELFDPLIDFSFKLPNVDKSTEQLTYAKIDTTNDAVMNQQLIYLLVLGSFSYDQVNTSTIGASSFNLISNQLSNWLSQISKDFDIGINYRPGDNLSREELEFALSTQLFDNRVTIDGNVGMIGFQNSSSTESDIVGDVNIEVKLTDDGRFRIKAFNRSNVSTIENINEYDNLAPNTQGVGIFYRKEFDNFSDLFRKKSSQRKAEKVESDSTQNQNSGSK